MEVKTKDESGSKYIIYYFIITVFLVYLLLLVIPGLFLDNYLAIFGTIPFIVILLFALRFYVSAFAAIRPMRPRVRYSKAKPFVSIIIPAFNEEAVLNRTIPTMLAMDYPKDRIEFLYVYEPHCTDRTEEIILRFAKTDPRVRPLKRPPGGPGGKAAPTNYAITFAKGKIIGIFDADHSLNRDVVKKAVELFRDPTVGCARGRCRIINRDTNLLTRVVSVERDTIERIGIYAAYRLGGFANFGGGHGFFRRDIFKTVGKFDEDLLCEDIDFTVRMYMAGYRLIYMPDIQSWEESPSSFRSLWNQRKRWSRGWMQVWRRYITKIPGATKMSMFRKMDTAVSLTTSVSSIITIFVFPLLLLTFLGYSTTFFAQVVSLPLWLFVTLTPIISGIFIFILDRDEKIKMPLSDVFVSILLIPYIFLMFLVNWTAFMDEFLLDKPYAYVKCERTEDRNIHVNGNGADLHGEGTEELRGKGTDVSRGKGTDVSRGKGTAALRGKMNAKKSGKDTKDRERKRGKEGGWGGGE